MKVLIPIFIVSVIFSSYGSGSKNRNENSNNDIIANKDEFLALYFLNDEKYAIDDPVINIDEWINKKIEVIAMYGDSNSLFHRKGGDLQNKNGIH